MKKRPRDINKLAKSVVDITTGEQKEEQPKDKDAAAVKMGRKGGKKGGKARAKALTPEQRSEIARIAAEARWKKKGS